MGASIEDHYAGLRGFLKNLHGFVMPVSAPTAIVPRASLAEWASLHAHLVWVYDGAVSPQGRSGRVSAFDLTAWLIREGRVVVKLGERTWRSGPNEWLFPRPANAGRIFPLMPVFSPCVSARNGRPAKICCRPMLE